jgi:small-conductance mechanosensitive channel
VRPTGYAFLVLLAFQTERISDNFDESLIWTAIVIGFALLTRFLLVRGVVARVGDTEAKVKTRKTISYSVGVMLAISVAWIWVPSFNDVATLIGLVAAGTTIALAPVIINFAGWVFVLLRRPFRVGDRIEIAGVQGDVIDTRLQRFTVLEIGNWVDADQSTGRIVHIPNNKVFSEALANFSAGFEYVWHEIPVMVPFDSNWKSAEKAMREVLEDLQSDEHTEAMRRQLKEGEFYIRYRELKPTVYVDTAASGVVLTARIIAPARGRRITEDRFWRDLLSRFDEIDDVRLAYNTLRTIPTTRPEGQDSSGVT